MIVEVVEGTRKMEDGTEKRFRLINAADPVTGLQVQIPMSVEQAEEVGETLCGRGRFGSGLTIPREAENGGGG